MNYFEVGYIREVIIIVCMNGGVNLVILCVIGVVVYDGSFDMRMFGL